MAIFDSKDITVIAEGRPGTVTFGNYDFLKSQLEEGLAYYNLCEYTLDNIDVAKTNRDELKAVKKVLENKKKEIESAYQTPYTEVMKKLDELIEMVKLPFKNADDFIKESEKAAKKKEIITYAQKKAAVLGKHADKIISSPAFYNSAWEKISCKTKQWQSEIDDIISRASDDMATINSSAGEHRMALMAHYYETLSMDNAKRFVESLKDGSEDDTAYIESSGVSGYKVLKIFATERQMLQLLTQLDIIGLDFEEIEDGMPKSMEETKIPSFDSFVAFDIEHTGTYGAANGDAEAEIIEIGAVKVENGVVVDKFDMLCNPGRKIVPRIAKLTNITDEMLADKPSVDEIIKAFKDFAGNNTLVGHNIKGCDIPHISRAAKRASVVFDNTYLDTRILANMYKEKMGWENIKLTTLSEYFGIKQIEAHRAWCDAEANAYVYLKLKELNK